MQDQDRVANIMQRLKLLSGLDEPTYQRLLHELDASRERAGLSAEVLTRVTLFDAKPHDVESFDRANLGRFPLHYVRAALNLDTARAAEGSRAACIFVNDTCDAAVVERLAKLGVELIALRFAGFNHVDIQACARLGVQVVRVPAYSPYAVAEFTIALMMVLNRRIHHAYARTAPATSSWTDWLASICTVRRRESSAPARSDSASSTFCSDSVAMCSRLTSSRTRSCCPAPAYGTSNCLSCLRSLTSLPSTCRCSRILTT